MCEISVRVEHLYYHFLKNAFDGSWLDKAFIKRQKSTRAMFMMLLTDACKYIFSKIDLQSKK